MRNLRVPNSDALDPPARRASWLFPWWNRDQARGPMQWRAGPGGGFTSGRPSLPLGPDTEARNVAAQSGEPASVLSMYRRLVQLRRSIPALALGDQQLLDVRDPDVLAYRRSLDGRSAVVALNFASRSAGIRLPTLADGASWQVALPSDAREAGARLSDTVTLSPLEVLIAYD